MISARFARKGLQIVFSSLAIEKLLSGPADCYNVTRKMPMPFTQPARNCTASKFCSRKNNEDDHQRRYSDFTQLFNELKMSWSSRNNQASILFQRCFERTFTPMFSNAVKFVYPIELSSVPTPGLEMTVYNSILSW